MNILMYKKRIRQKRVKKRGTAIEKRERRRKRGSGE